jgi:tetratricopeptide (TPR) repeat protein
MTPVSFNPGAYSPWAYRMTQPLVALRFFTKFFIPTGLSADTDHIPLTSIFDAGGIEGCLFVLALIAFIVLTSKRDDLWIIRFGLTWFLVAMIPTSLMAVSEVENDHRMFFPFIGLALAASYALYKVIWWRPMWMTVVIVFTIFCVFSIGTWQRCEVWHTEETLWHDVTLKSPQNGRGLMNYGLTLMSKGDYRGADYYFGRAAFFAPNYYILEINRGIVSASMGRQVESDQHFQRALDLDKDAARIMLQFASSAKFMAEKRKS